MFFKNLIKHLKYIVDGKARKNMFKNKWMLNEYGLMRKVKDHCKRKILSWLGLLRRTNWDQITKQIYAGRVNGLRGRRNRENCEWMELCSWSKAGWNVWRRIVVYELMHWIDCTISYFHFEPCTIITRFQQPWTYL